MLKYCTAKWAKNKYKLEDVIREDKNINSYSYGYLVELIVKYVLNDEDAGWGELWNEKEISEIDNGDYQGTLLYLIPSKIYQPGPANYLMTFVDYGSCSVCDTLERIQSEHYGGKPTEEQIKDYMTLCLHLVQHMIKPYKGFYDNDEEFEEEEEV